MSGDLIIRPVTAQDQTAWKRLWSGYLEFYQQRIDESVYETAFERLLSDDLHEFQGLIAELDGTPVGLAHFLFHRFLWSVEDTCYLLDLYCDPGCRGTGVGRALIEAVHDVARQAGIPGTYWMTQENNYRGRMLYDSVGEKTPFIVYEKH